MTDDRPTTHADDAGDEPFIPRRRPVRKLIAWLILIGIALSLIAMIVIVVVERV